MTDVVQKVAMKALIVDPRGRLLILREAGTHPGGTQSGRYQMPGGKVDPGESYTDALHREVREETGLKIEIGRPLLVGEWRPVVHGTQLQIIATFFACKLVGPADITLSEEHDSYEWIDPKDYKTYDLVEPDDRAILALTS